MTQHDKSYSVRPAYIYLHDSTPMRQCPEMTPPENQIAMKTSTYVVQNVFGTKRTVTTNKKKEGWQRCSKTDTFHFSWPSQSNQPGEHRHN